jgi:predicted acetyltransferase
MPDFELVLRFPREDEEEEFTALIGLRHRHIRAFFTTTKKGCRSGRYLKALAEQQRGEHITHDQVPSTSLFAFVGSNIVGRVSIRHALNPFLERAGGHIGYAVVPRFRRRGYATEILRQALIIARERLVLDRVLLTCDDDNVGSIKTIERNGGVLENTVTEPDSPKPKRRY